MSSCFTPPPPMPDPATIPAAPPLLAMRGITKRFPGVIALQDVSLFLRAGEVLIDGQPVALSGVRAAKKLGIALIHQELMLAPNLDIAANIFLGNEVRPLGAAGPLGRRAMNA